MYLSTHHTSSATIAHSFCARLSFTLILPSRISLKNFPRTVLVSYLVPCLYYQSDNICQYLANISENGPSGFAKWQFGEAGWIIFSNISMSSSDPFLDCPPCGVPSSPPHRFLAWPVFFQPLLGLSPVVWCPFLPTTRVLGLACLLQILSWIVPLLPTITRVLVFSRQIFMKMKIIILLKS